ncbi:2-hydroxyisocaproyl-CoA dehydratase activator HadI [Clostridium botulinum]|uniref:2-hydroxyglutaryl-CoA dehydratase component A n=1 Tax=Clostridium botulinum (strain Langeland / NCTC 10281 / Type F) TaxID=441772 RepID=A7GFC5_CLOBL|nr:2-hydroxyisocaproyl-CoA dehydratase activator HadI [Clostridium botulinum]ABS42130.1 2-hydroxyglutaryl-CoA dehydratase component A [Clostridium botulinum F str. Langeland]ADF99886.1 2-hydroxyglutaryl-CoA dehydratase component A [Clostridium botulinum F str. 230613]KKM42538.1 2-hydroxyglutaryl-CoA dehydratase [Clostridium botulinum]MBY6792976.1 2-hydroxyglutaryl-CoA dehydratase [Clostridium botulinum]MBY6937185.1 2-hydroxyglutaryl-CoA dehydratase [Clostridium botulinum]
MYTMGLDIGSTTSKGVIMKDGKEIVASVLVPVGTGTSGPLKLIKELKEKSNLTEKDIEKTVVTGYGRIQYKDADKQISELSCHAKGVAFLIPGARTIIDIGGQDAKAMKLNDKGKLINFIMNDKCAAGTGRFLDVMAGVLETDVSKLGEISEKSTKEVSISSTCTVFAESEVISHLSANAKKEDIIAGIHTSVVRRVSTLAMRVGIEDQVVMVGGVARNKGIVKAMEKELGHDIKVPELAQLTGALGAAIYAFEETK